MEELLQYLSEFNSVTVLFRIALAALAGGIVGVERGLHGRAAGMRTHMMVSMGAALTTMLGVYNVEALGVTWADPMRIGAQVISGVGFLGAGTILLKRGSNSQISGLTTAAGLWTTAIIGLAIGVGFYEGAVMTMLAVLIAYTVISRLESRMSRKRRKMFVYLEIDDVDSIPTIIGQIKERHHASEIQVTPSRSGTPGHVGLEALIINPSKKTVNEKIEDLQAIEHVKFVLYVR